MVPIMTAEQKAEDPLLVCVEPYSELPVDKSGFKGSIPDVQNMKPLDKFGAYVERKLFVHNMSHATAAYFGFLKGHEYIWQAITDPDVRAEVEAALKETCAGMVSKHGLDGAALRAHGEDLMERYANRALGDQVARIGKDPVRKLGPQDRLLGSARMCMEQDVKPVHVARSAAAGMHFNPPGDPTAERVQEIRRARGIQGVCEEICGLNGREPLTRLIEQADKNLKDEGWFR
jgi:mannitol-1-phosphate 5-dehydrogenase